MFSIYQVTNILDGKRYIGYTTQTPILRWRRHQRSAKGGSKTHFHSAIRKYGKDEFQIAIHEMGENHEYGLKVAEPMYIEWLKPEYNETLGGQGPNGLRKFKHSEIFKQKQAARMKGKQHSLGYKFSPEHAEKVRQRQLGVPLRDSHKKSISKALKGRKLSPSHVEKLKGRISSQKGIPHTPEWKQFMSKKLTGYKWPILECPFCAKFGSISNMKRWHFNNCKKR